MGIEIPTMTYSGSIKTVAVAGAKGFTLGGETALPFYTFEGKIPNPPKVAVEINDIPPKEWAPALVAKWGDVLNDPVAWAKKAEQEFGAELIHLELVGVDPNGENLSPEHAVDVVKKVAAAISVPLCVWGCANQPKDMEVLRAVAAAVTDRQLLIGPIQDENYKQLGAGVIGYNHIAIASSPIDINLAKQLNILLGNLGVPDSRIVIDPTTGGLGYGLEYSYSVMERARMAALAQQDEKLQYPLYCNLGKEVWKTKEAKLSAQDAPELGDPEKRGILMEAITATAVLSTGADVVVLRHPETIRLVRQLLNDLLGT
ncbi:MAG: acetyl-CoA decarbonylase/synthase complex subunit delta [Myxococcales bacterium]|nr:MAG: acetyl-CoA decarbonylase/synthase complex subunit delta [Myxococcales bacterium]